MASKLGFIKISASDRQYEKGKSFTTYAEVDPLYVEPFFSILSGKTEEHPQIVLVSCAGAVGKSAMSRYMSAKYHMPILDLAIHKAVGDSTMTGILANEYNDLTYVKQELKDGRETIIIDAIDEGLLKVSTEGFHAFLDDVVKITKGSGGDHTPFIITGRPTSILETAAYLDKADVKFIWMQIEPFTVKEAGEFIDRLVRHKYKMDLTPAYFAARDQLLSSVECFFKAQNEAAKKSYLNFIGYAPVLESIAKLIGTNQNYQKIIARLNLEGYKSTNLLLEILRYILDRDKEKKVIPGLVEEIIANRDEEFKAMVRERIYTPQEQCARILAITMDIDPEISPVDDPSFLSKYQEKIGMFAKEHPFLDDGKLTNVVFESYVLAVLSGSPEYSYLVELYVQKAGFKNSFALFPIFASVNGVATSSYKEEGYAPTALPSYLLCDICESFNSMISENITGRINIDGYEDQDEETINFDVEYTCQNVDKPEVKEEVSMSFDMKSTAVLNLGKGIRNASINGDMTIKASGHRVTLEAPLKIDCKKFVLTAEELQVISKTNEDVSITTESFVVEQEGGQYPKIIADKACFKILTNESLSYPADGYLDCSGENGKGEYDVEFFNKLRRLLLSFRCDSKGQGNWAKYKNKIDMRFNDGLGKEALEVMINEGIIYPKEFMYKIDVPLLGSRLGVKYDNLKSCNPSEKMIEFMNEVHSKS